MRYGGFPCRFTSCRVIFGSTDGSLEALQQASKQRSAHEIEVHGYTHRLLNEPERRSAPWVSRTTPQKAR